MVKSAQEFVRALKAPSDPPDTGGPVKIQIASEVWHDSSFHVPNKEEVIVDWILTRLLKDKDKKQYVLARWPSLALSKSNKTLTYSFRCACVEIPTPYATSAIGTSSATF